MSKLVFVFYYSGLLGLLAAYTVNDVRLDRVALVLLVLGCWLHARVWKRHIESVITPVSSISAGLDLLNIQRQEMDVFVRLMPNLFSTFLAARSIVAKAEYRFVREPHKSLAVAVRAFWGNIWEIIPVILCGAIPIWWFGIGQWHYERFFQLSPLLHDLMTHLMVAVLSFILSVRLTAFFVFHSLRK
jgi:hypothetical protein